MQEVTGALGEGTVTSDGAASTLADSVLVAVMTEVDSGGARLTHLTKSTCSTQGGKALPLVAAP